MKGSAGESMKILLTGSSGTIGTRLFERLLPDYEIIGVDLRQNKWLPELNVKALNIDLRKTEELAKIPQDIDLIVHFAANARVYKSVENPELALHNMLINFNVVEFARKRKIKRIIFASSREVYGNIQKGGVITEDMMRLENCESPYSASKVSGEALLHTYHKVYGVDFVIVRFSNVYGMYDDSDRVIPLWLRQCLRNDDLILYGEEKVLDFTYIDDAVNGAIKTIEYFDKVKGNIFNIAYGKGVSLLRVAQEIKRLTTSQSKIIIKKCRPGEVWKFEADISRAKKLLGYNPKVGIEEGLAKTVDWYIRRVKPNVG